MSAPNTPLPLSDYAERVQSRYYSAMTLSADGRYRWRGLRHPRSVQIALDRYPDLDRSVGVAGLIDHQQQRFVHLTGPGTELVLSERPPTGPYLASANAPITAWHREQTATGSWRITLSAEGYVPLRLDLAGARRCQTVDGPDGRWRDGTSLALNQTSITALRLECF